jgi:preprotein translocase subunit SecE
LAVTLTVTETGIVTVTVTVKENMAKITTFISEARVELKKVNWPSRKELIDSTKVVLITSFLLAAFIGVVDFILSQLITAVIG